MVKRSSEKPAPKKAPTVEEEPDAWERFERAVDHVMKAPPKHREKPKPSK